MRGGTHIELPHAAGHCAPLVIHAGCVSAEVTLRCGSRQAPVRHRLRWDWCPSAEGAQQCWHSRHQEHHMTRHQQHHIHPDTTAALG